MVVGKDVSRAINNKPRTGTTAINSSCINLQCPTIAPPTLIGSAADARTIAVDGGSARTIAVDGESARTIGVDGGSARTIAVDSGSSRLAVLLLFLSATVEEPGEQYNRLVNFNEIKLNLFI